MNRTILMLAGAFSASSLLLVDSAAKGTALLVLAAVAALILRRDSAATRHLVWLLAVVALLVVPVLSALLPQWRVLPEWAAISPPPEARQRELPPQLSRVPLPPVSQSPQNAEQAEHERHSPAADQEAAKLPDSRPAPATAETVAAPAVWRWLNALPLVWAIGFSVLIVRLMAARMLLWNYEWRGTVLGSPNGSPTQTARKQPANTSQDPLVTALEDACRQLGIRRAVTLSIHPDKTIPVVWGILRCHLLLPAAARQWSGEQLRSVLLHELAHVRRRDTLAQLLTQIACALHWFNPLVWFAAWRLGVERERACDDLVLASGVRPSAYAGHLLDVVTGLAPARWTQTCGLAMARRSSLEGRLVAVLSQNLNRRGVSVALAAIALVVGAGIAVPIAMLRAANNAPAPDEERVSSKTTAPAAGEDSPPVAAPKDDQAVMKPRHESAQRLFKIWQDNARTDGKIPGGALRSLADAVTNFIKLNPTHERVPQLTEFLKRIDTSHDWRPADAVALLDDLTAIYPTLPDWAGRGARFSPGGPIRSGQPLPAELAGAAWGRPAANGLRAAWVLDPGGGAYALGTNLKARILFHNSGTKTVVFRTPDWHQYANHEARDAKGKAIPVSATEWTRLVSLETIRLAPGDYAEAEAHGIGIGPHNRNADQWAEVRVGAWIEAKAGDEVTFQPGAVSASGDRWTPPADRKTPAKMWWAILRDRLDREGPMPSAAADREQLIRRAMPDLIGLAPTKEEIAAFVTDRSSDPLTGLANRLMPRLAPFAGDLPAGEIRFRVTAADPDAAKKPRVATGPGRYTIGDLVRLVVVQKPDGKRRLNEASIEFYSRDPKANPPGKPYEIQLPDGHLTWAIAWERGTTVLWVTQKGIVRKIDFADPADVKETRFEDGGTVNVPEHLRDAFRKAFDVPGAPVQQQESQRPKVGAKLQPGTEQKLKWGEPVNGLRAALVIRTSPDEPGAGDAPDLYLLVQNVSDAPIHLSDTIAAPNVRYLTLHHDDLPQGRTKIEVPTLTDVMLQPREAAYLLMCPRGTTSRGQHLAAGMLKEPHMILVGQVNIEKAPRGAWTGKLVTPPTGGEAAQIEQQEGPGESGVPAEPGGAKPAGGASALPRQTQLFNDKYSAIAVQTGDDVNFVLIYSGSISNSMESWVSSSGAGADQKWGFNGAVYLVDTEKTRVAKKNVNKRKISVKFTSDTPDTLLLDGKAYRLNAAVRTTSMGARELPGRIFILRDEGEPVRTNRTLPLRNVKDLVTIGDFADQDLALYETYGESRRVQAMEGWVLGWDEQDSIKFGDGQRKAILRIFPDGRVLSLPGGRNLTELRLPAADVAELLRWLAEEQKVGEWKPETVKANGVEIERDPVKNMWDRETEILFFMRGGKRHGIVVEDIEPQAATFRPIRGRLMEVLKKATPAAPAGAAPPPGPPAK